MEKPRIIVVGGGFAGLEGIKQLDSSNQFELILVDVNNYNFFPPLLYQVAGGFMEPSAISYPFRRILRKRTNTRFWMGELQSINPSAKSITLNNGELTYDYLILATGAETNFFGNENIANNALPMKTISDALGLRNVIYTRLEKATRTEDETERKKLLNFVIAGAGPTGVELSGIFAEMKTFILSKDYPELIGEDTGDIYLIDGVDAVLSPMSTNAQTYTHKKLEELGIQIHLDTLVEDFKDDIVYLDNGNKLESKNLIWAAGVAARVFDGLPKESYGKGRRLLVNQFSQLLAYDSIFAIGDTALMTSDENYPEGHPQLAQVAIQQAKQLGKNLATPKENWQPFTYKDKGSMAIIGRNKAVADLPNEKLFFKGFFAWIIWVFIHIASLVNFKNKIRALYNWMGYYFNKDQTYRMIIRPKPLDKD